MNLRDKLTNWWNRRKRRAAMADLGEKILAQAWQEKRVRTAQEHWDRKKQPRSKYAVRP